MSLLDDMANANAFGFGFGAKATDEAFNAVSNRYREKDFDPVVRGDLMVLDIIDSENILVGLSLEEVNEIF